MLNKILSLSLQNRLLVLVGAVVLSLVGGYIAKNMNVDVFPDLTAPSVTILTEAHGMESGEVEKTSDLSARNSIERLAQHKKDSIFFSGRDFYCVCRV